jgi:predicted nucleotidyltransferase
MEVGPGKLIETLLEFDRHFGRTITMVAVGGTALTLLGKKESTKDIDVCFESGGDLSRFVKVAGRLGYRTESGRLVGHGIIIDVYSNGYIFCVQLPQDYRERAIAIRKMDKIQLFAISPEDLAITKTARLNERDIEDIKTIFSSYDIEKEALVSRYVSAMESSVVKDAKPNLEWLADNFGFSGRLKKRIAGWEHG